MRCPPGARALTKCRWCVGFHSFEELHERGKGATAQGPTLFAARAAPQPTHEEEMRSFQEELLTPPPRPPTPSGEKLKPVAAAAALFETVGVEVPAAEKPTPSAARRGWPEAVPLPPSASGSSALVNPRVTWTSTLDRTIEVSFSSLHSLGVFRNRSVC